MKDIYCSCGNPIENHDTGLCSSCGIAARKEAKDAIKLTKQQERKKAQRLSGMKEKRTPIKKVSDKRSDQNELYKLLSRGFLVKHPLCEVCGNLATEINHKKGRENDMLCKSKYFMAVCRPCHLEIHANPEWAYRNSYSLSRTKTNEQANQIPYTKH